MLSYRIGALGLLRALSITDTLCGDYATKVFVQLNHLLEFEGWWGHGSLLGSLVCIWPLQVWRVQKVRRVVSAMNRFVLWSGRGESSIRVSIQSMTGREPRLVRYYWFRRSTSRLQDELTTCHTVQNHLSGRRLWQMRDLAGCTAGPGKTVARRRGQRRCLLGVRDSRLQRYKHSKST